MVVALGTAMRRYSRIKPKPRGGVPSIHGGVPSPSQETRITSVRCARDKHGYRYRHRCRRHAHPACGVKAGSRVKVGTVAVRMPIRRVERGMEKCVRTRSQPQVYTKPESRIQYLRTVPERVNWAHHRIASTNEHPTAMGTGKVGQTPHPQKGGEEINACRADRCLGDAQNQAQAKNTVVV